MVFYPIFAQNEINIWYKDCTNCATDDVIKTKGMDVFETQKLLLKKVEELTLHVIAKQDELNRIKSNFKN